MAWVFSKRCQQSLKAGKIKVSIPRNVRIRLWKLLNKYNKVWYETTETGWNYTTNRIEQLKEAIKSEHGWNILLLIQKNKREKLFPPM